MKKKENAAIKSREQRHPSKVTFFLSVMLLLALWTPKQSFAEGSKELSPNTSNLSALALMPSRGTGSYNTCPVDNRIYIDINAGEKLYFGFNWRKYTSSSTFVNGSMSYYIYNVGGTQVATGTFNSGNTPSTAGYIDDLTSAQNGPNIGSVSNGYNPLSFTPVSTGKYYITFAYTGSSPDGSGWYLSPYFDLTVADGSNNKKPGRVYSQKWGLVAVNSSSSFAPDALASASPTFYPYTDDQTVSKITIQSGFMPIAYDIAANKFGVDATQNNWLIGRKSINSANSPNLSGGYKVFLNPPDAALYPVPVVSQAPTLASPAIVGCSPYKVRYNMPAAGDAQLLLDFNGTPGYQAGTKDVLLEALDVSAGAHEMDWDGKDGLGATVLSGTTIKLTAIYLKGRINIPLYDAEINKNGLNYVTYAPGTPNVNIRLFWDDSGLTNVGSNCSNQANNQTGTGLDNSLQGTISPAHAWNGDGNLSQTIPAPAVNNNDASTNNNQCDDFGNVRVINTWGWGVRIESSVFEIKFGCFTVSGNVFNDSNGMTDNQVNGSGTNAGGLKAVLVDADGNVFDVTNVNANGTYSFTGVSSGNYTVLLIKSTETVTKGSPAPTSSILPTGWSSTGEKLGTGNGDDGYPADGKLALTVDAANVSNANFGIQQPPTASDVSKSVNGAPVLNTPVSLTDMPLKGMDPEDQSTQGSWGGKKLVITSMPTNGFVLTYDGHEITPTDIGATGYIIDNYDPSKLTITPKTTPGGVKVTEFNYVVIDAAGARSPDATATIDFSQPLPVVFGNIQARFANGQLVVNFESLKEVNNDHFEIEVSGDGIRFAKIGELKSSAQDGNSTAPINYNFSGSIASLTLGLSMGLLILGSIGFSLSRRKRILFGLVLLAGLATLYTGCKKGDVSPNNKEGNVYVRVVQVDKDGNKSYSKIVKAVKD